MAENESRPRAVDPLWRLEYERAIGPSALIHGSERRAWNRLVDHLDLVDNYICAGVRKGSHFTKQAWKLDRYDQSRLNCSYNS